MTSVCVCECVLGEVDVLDGVPHKVISEESSRKDEGQEYCQAEEPASAKAPRIHSVPGTVRRPTRASGENKGRSGDTDMPPSLFTICV